jgi:hypothetical protein
MATGYWILRNDCILHKFWNREMFTKFIHETQKSSVEHVSEFGEA